MKPESRPARIGHHPTVRPVEFGLQRLTIAIRAVEIAQNNGENFSLEELSARINVSTKTLSRLWSLNASVDQKTLKLCFSTFGLELGSEDYIIAHESDLEEDREDHEASEASSDKKEGYPFQSITFDSTAREIQEKYQYLGQYPSGPVPLDSPLYIERPPIEELAGGKSLNLID